jgi:hypothetical protein
MSGGARSAVVVEAVLRVCPGEPPNPTPQPTAAANAASQKPYFPYFVALGRQRDGTVGQAGNLWGMRDSGARRFSEILRGA